MIIMMSADVAMHAQPTLRASNIGPRAGDRIIYYNTQFHPVGFGGAGQTWDFSTLEPIVGRNGIETREVEHPPEALRRGNVIADRCSHGSDYLSFDSSALQWLGYDYTRDLGERRHHHTETALDPETLMKYPFTYGDAFVDSFHTMETIDDISYEWIGDVAVTADGWGTLSVKGRTISGVLRTKTIVSAIRLRRNEDGTNDTGIMNRVVYKWYLPGHHEWLLYIRQAREGYECDICGQADGGYTSISGGADLALTGNEVPVSLVQNPVFDNLRLRAGTDGQIHYRIVDTKGSVIRRGEWNTVVGNELSVPLDDMPPGVYCISFSSQEMQTTTKRFQKE